MVDQSVNDFIEMFRDLRDRGDIPSVRLGNTGIGATINHALNFADDNLQAPDYQNIEIKSYRTLTKSKITLFCKIPTNPQDAARFIRETYGEPHGVYPQHKIIHTTPNYASFNNHRGRFGFKLELSDEERKLYLRVINLVTGNLERQDLWWSYDALEHSINAKYVKYLALIRANHRVVDGQEVFNYRECKIYHGFSFEVFKQLLMEDVIKLEFQVGVYMTGTLAGKLHDHGYAFRIAKPNLSRAFQIVEL